MPLRCSSVFSTGAFINDLSDDIKLEIRLFADDAMLHINLQAM